MSDVELWSATDASNNDAPPDGFPEGMNRSDYNNSARAVMGAVRRFFNASEFVNLYAEPARVVSKVTDTQIRVAGVDVTTDFPVDRRVQITDGTTTVSGFVTAAVFAAGDTTVTVVLDSGVVPAATNKVLVHSGKTLKKLAFRNSAPFDSVIDVKEDHGAVGDGVANDQPAIQAAIDAAEAANGGVVYFPPGQYLCNTGLVLDSPQVMLLGAGRGHAILVNGSATAHLLTIGQVGADTWGITVRDLSFATKAGIVATNGSCIRLIRANWGIYLESLSFGFNYTNVGNAPWRAIDSDGTTGRCFGIMLRGLGVDGMLSGGIYLNNMSDVICSDLTISNVGADGGIVIDTSQFITVVNADILACTPTGVRIRQTLTPVAPSAGGNHDCVFSNVMSWANNGPNWWITRNSLTTYSGCISLAPNGAIATQDGFFFDGSGVPNSDIVEIALTGCHSQGGDRHGFHLNRVSRASITGCRGWLNSASAADGAGIMLDGCEDCSVVGNNMVERSSGSVQKYGIRVANASNRNLIGQNLARGNITKNLEDTSSGTNLFRNNSHGDARPTVASAATVTLPNLADDLVEITGVTQIDNFGGGEIGKVVRCYFPSALTIRHNGGGTGNIRLAGSVNVSTTAGSIISFEKIEATPIYREVARALA